MAECLLCHSLVENTIKGADDRIFYTCSTCSLIFSDKKHHLNAIQEKARYLNHDNSLLDQNYLDFLSKAVVPALSFLNPTMQGLDYGCGPVLALQHILEKNNIACASYDPYFYPSSTSATSSAYDFIFSTEAFEHFYNPALELTKLREMLKNKGFLIIMTEFHQGKDHFKNWYYTRDPSHVCFYNLSVFDYICTEYNLSPVFTDNKRVIILQK